MSRSDARENPYRTIAMKMDTLTAEVVARIEEELDPYDMRSMVFLLYDVPDTALQKLSAYQRYSREDSNLNLLSSWARDQQPNWRETFLEGLAICQLYNIVRKLGFHVGEVKEFYQPDTLEHHVHINRMKKALYKLCDNITSQELLKLKKALSTYECDTKIYDSCELILLKLMSDKKITVPYLPDEDGFKKKYDIELLIKIIQNFSGLQKLTSELRDIQSMLNRDTESSAFSTMYHFDGETEDLEANDNDVTHAFDEVYKLISRMTIEETPPPKNLKSDNQNSKNYDGYKIKDPHRLGVCYIINQVTFHPSKESISKNTAPIPLENRHGSNRDCGILKKTFTSLNFEVLAHSNVDHDKMKELIENIIEYRVQLKDSMFVLCILSHGVKGHVYAADSVPVKVVEIQNWLDNCFQKRKLDMPKIMILQACQVDNEHEAGSSRLVADSSPSTYLRKAHFLVYWATAPELEAFRNEIKGSIFIQMLCYLLTKLARQEDVFSIFTKVTKLVAQVCKFYEKDQTPIFESTLMEKLYLQEPE